MTIKKCEIRKKLRVTAETMGNILCKNASRLSTDCSNVRAFGDMIIDRPTDKWVTFIKLLLFVYVVQGFLQLLYYNYSVSLAIYNYTLIYVEKDSSDFALTILADKADKNE